MLVAVLSCAPPPDLPPLGSSSSTLPDRPLEPWLNDGASGTCYQGVSPEHASLATRLVSLGVTIRECYCDHVLCGLLISAEPGAEATVDALVTRTWGVHDVPESPSFTEAGRVLVRRRPGGYVATLQPDGPQRKAEPCRLAPTVDPPDPLAEQVVATTQPRADTCLQRWAIVGGACDGAVTFGSLPDAPSTLLLETSTVVNGAGLEACLSSALRTLALPTLTTPVRWRWTLKPERPPE